MAAARTSDMRIYADCLTVLSSRRWNWLTIAAYIHARGSIEVNGVSFKAGDGARVRNETALQFANGNNAEVLVFDLRPVEVNHPQR